MAKNYEVTVRASAVVYVEGATDQDQAYEFARNTLDNGDFDDLELSAEELKTPEDASRSERHANVRSKL